MNKKLSTLTSLAALIGLQVCTLDAQIIFSEDFETGLSEGQTSATIVTNGFTIENGFNNRTDFWAVEGPGSDPAGTGNNGADLFDALTNTRGFGLRDLDDANNPGGPNYITFAPITTTGFATPFIFSFDVTNSVSTGNTTAADQLRVVFDLNYDGITFDADETYTLTGNGSGALTDGTSTAVEGSFTSFSHSIVGTATGDLGLRIQAISFTGGGDQVTFDNLEITAVPEPSAAALLGGLCALSWVMLRRRS